ncbi:proline-rich protein 36-like [Dermochelys coriacea]|uniref:proline-rich protein 36-like n=1 Tax=Dermochelys coriacea TaxID=27794 RepID=UPI001CA8E0B3|nr:proline-rich protein 36-like [Dermochelys coriacea]
MQHLAQHLGEVTGLAAWRAEFPNGASSSVDSCPSSLGSCPYCSGRDAACNPREPWETLPLAPLPPRPWHPFHYPGAAGNTPRAGNSQPLPKRPAAGARGHRARSPRLPILGQGAPRSLEFSMQCNHLWGAPTPHTESPAPLVPSAPTLCPGAKGTRASVAFSTSRVSFRSAEGHEELEWHVLSQQLCQEQNCLCPASYGTLPSLTPRSPNAQPTGTEQGLEPHHGLHGLSKTQIAGVSPLHPQQSQESCACIPAGSRSRAVLGHLTLAKVARLQGHLARKSLECQLEVLPRLVRRSESSAASGPKAALPRSVRPGAQAGKPWGPAFPAMPKESIHSLECKTLASLWGLPTLLTEPVAKGPRKEDAAVVGSQRQADEDGHSQQEIPWHIWAFPSALLHLLKALLLPAPGERKPQARADTVRHSQEPCVCTVALPHGDAGRTVPHTRTALDRLSPQAAARLQAHGARKCLEIKAGALPAMVSASQEAAPVGKPPALPELLHPGQRHRQPRPSTCPALEPEAAWRVELNIRQKGLLLLWGLPGLYTQSLARLVPSTPHLPAPSAVGRPGLELVEQGTPFLSATSRHNLEWHIRSKKLQHQWGLPPLLQRSLAAFLAPVPLPSALPARRPREVAIGPQELPFLCSSARRELESHLITMQAQHHWGLPGRVQASLHRFMPPAPGHAPASRPPTPGHVASGHPPTTDHTASGCPPTLGHAPASHPPTLGHASASHPPAPGHTASGHPPTPGHAPAGRPPTPGHAASGHPPTLGHALSSRPPTLGHAPASSPPTLSHAPASCSPTLGHAASVHPPTLGHAPASSPPTLGHVPASHLPTLSHAPASRSPTPGHAASGHPPTLDHASASQPPFQLYFKKGECAHSLPRMPSPGKPETAPSTSKPLPRAVGPSGPRAAGEEDGSVVQPRGQSGSRRSPWPVQPGITCRDPTQPHSHGAARSIPRLALQPELSAIGSRRRTPRMTQRHPKKRVVLRTDSHPKLGAQGSEGPSCPMQAGHPQGARASPEWLIRSIVKSLGTERAARDLQLRLLGWGQWSVEYPVCLQCCCLEGTCPHHPTPQGQRGPRLVVYPQLSVGRGRNRLHMSLGFLLRIKRKQACKWQLILEPPAKVGPGRAWEGAPCGQPRSQQGPGGALGVQHPKEPTPCRACSQATRPSAPPCPTTPHSGLGAQRRAPSCQLHEGSASGSTTEPPGAAAARAREPPRDPRPPREQSCVRAPPRAVPGAPAPQSQSQPSAPQRGASPAPPLAEVPRDTSFKRLFMSVQQAWAKLWGRPKPRTSHRRSGDPVVQPAPSRRPHSTKVSS